MDLYALWAVAGHSASGTTKNKDWKQGSDRKQGGAVFKILFLHHGPPYILGDKRTGWSKASSRWSQLQEKNRRAGNPRDVVGKGIDKIRYGANHPTPYVLR